MNKYNMPFWIWLFYRNEHLLLCANDVLMLIRFGMFQLAGDQTIIPVGLCIHFTVCGLQNYPQGRDSPTGGWEAELETLDDTITHWQEGEGILRENILDSL